jgi:hypothetical protein
VSRCEGREHVRWRRVRRLRLGRDVVFVMAGMVILGHELLGQGRGELIAAGLALIFSPVANRVQDAQKDQRKHEEAAPRDVD